MGAGRAGAFTRPRWGGGPVCPSNILEPGTPPRGQPHRAFPGHYRGHGPRDPRPGPPGKPGHGFSRPLFCDHPEHFRAGSRGGPMTIEAARMGARPPASRLRLLDRRRPCLRVPLPRPRRPRGPPPPRRTFFVGRSEMGFGARFVTVIPPGSPVAHLAVSGDVIEVGSSGRLVDAHRLHLTEWNLDNPVRAASALRGVCRDPSVLPPSPFPRSGSRPRSREGQSRSGNGPPRPRAWTHALAGKFDPPSHLPRSARAQYRRSWRSVSAEAGGFLGPRAYVCGLKGGGYVAGRGVDKPELNPFRAPGPRRPPSRCDNEARRHPFGRIPPALCANPEGTTAVVRYLIGCQNPEPRAPALRVRGAQGNARTPGLKCAGGWPRNRNGGYRVTVATDRTEFGTGLHVGAADRLDAVNEMISGAGAAPRPGSLVWKRRRRDGSWLRGTADPAPARTLELRSDEVSIVVLPRAQTW